MTEIRADNLQDRAGSGKPDLDVTPTHSGGSALTTLNTHSYTSSATEPSSPKNGALWWNSSAEEVNIYVNNDWYKITLNGSGTAYSNFSWGGTRNVYCCYNSTGDTNVIEYFSSVASAGATAQDFGDLTIGRVTLSATSSTTRCLFVGSWSDSNTASNSGRGQVIDYITIATTGNATDFGDLPFVHASQYVVEQQTATGNGTRGIFFAGNSNHDNAPRNDIQYVTIATTGNAADFGDLITASQRGGSCSDATRAVFAEGNSTSDTSIEYVTIDTTGNATSFGTQTIDHGQQFQGCSDATRGVFTGGEAGGRINSMSYITIQTTGNTTDFGDLTAGRARHGCTSDGTYGTVIGARNDGTAGTSGSYSDRIDRFTIQTTGNATDFADAVYEIRYAAAGAGNPS